MDEKVSSKSGGIVFKFLRHILFKIKKYVDKSRIIYYNVVVDRNTLIEPLNYAVLL